jgi:hypothetical protein
LPIDPAPFSFSTTTLNEQPSRNGKNNSL